MQINDVQVLYYKKLETKMAKVKDNICGNCRSDLDIKYMPDGKTAKLVKCNTCNEVKYQNKLKEKIQERETPSNPCEVAPSEE